MVLSFETKPLLHMKYSILFLNALFIFTQCTEDKVIDNTLHTETITFTSKANNLIITADTYLKEANKEFILLCHQAGYSRGEYLNTAPIFAEKGYNCMAMDQRSGNEVNGVLNQTAAKAKERGLPTRYIDAKPDILAAIDKAYELNDNKPIYLLGSSYSSSWALILGKDNIKVKAAIAFSPRENLSGINITTELSGYAKPVFVTSALSETTTTANLVVNIGSQYLTHFKSAKAGIHGSRCLWDTTEGHEEYWQALLDFLKTN